MFHHSQQEVYNSICHDSSCYESFHTGLAENIYLHYTAAFVLISIFLLALYRLYTINGSIVIPATTSELFADNTTTSVATPTIDESSKPVSPFLKVNASKKKIKDFAAEKAEKLVRSLSTKMGPSVHQHPPSIQQFSPTKTTTSTTAIPNSPKSKSSIDTNNVQCNSDNLKHPVEKSNSITSVGSIFTQLTSDDDDDRNSISSDITPSIGSKQTSGISLNGRSNIVNAVYDPLSLVGWKVSVEGYGTGIIRGIKKVKFFSTRYVIDFEDGVTRTVKLKRGEKKGNVPFLLVEKVTN